MQLLSIKVWRLYTLHHAENNMYALQLNYTHSHGLAVLRIRIRDSHTQILSFNDWYYYNDYTLLVMVTASRDKATCRYKYKALGLGSLALLFISSELFNALIFSGCRTRILETKFPFTVQCISPTTMWEEIVGTKSKLDHHGPACLPAWASFSTQPPLLHIFRLENSDCYFVQYKPNGSMHVRICPCLPCR